MIQKVFNPSSRVPLLNLDCLKESIGTLETVRWRMLHTFQLKPVFTKEGVGGTGFTKKYDMTEPVYYEGTDDISMRRIVVVLSSRRAGRFDGGDTVYAGEDLAFAFLVSFCIDLKVSLGFEGPVSTTVAFPVPVFPSPSVTAGFF